MPWCSTLKKITIHRKNLRPDQLKRNVDNLLARVEGGGSSDWFIDLLEILPFVPDNLADKALRGDEFGGLYIAMAFKNDFGTFAFYGTDKEAEILKKASDDGNIAKLLMLAPPIGESGERSFEWKFPTSADGVLFEGDHRIHGSVRRARVVSKTVDFAMPLEEQLLGEWSLAFGPNYGKLFFYQLPGLEEGAFAPSLKQGSDRGLGLFYPLLDVSSGQIDRAGKRWVRLANREGDWLSMELCEPGDIGARRDKELLSLNGFVEPDGTAMLTGFQMKRRGEPRIQRYVAGAYARKGDFLTTPSRGNALRRPSYEDIAGRWRYVAEGDVEEIQVAPHRGQVSWFSGVVTRHLEAWSDVDRLEYDVWGAKSANLNQYLVRVKDSRDTYSMMHNPGEFARGQRHSSWPKYQFGMMVDCQPGVIAGIGNQSGEGFYLQQLERYVAPEEVNVDLYDNPYESYNEFDPVPPMLRGVVLRCDENGTWTPVVNAAVTATPTSGRRARSPSNQQGKFGLRLRPGTWRIMARKGDLISQTEEVDLAAEDEFVTLLRWYRRSMAMTVGGGWLPRR